MNNCVNTPCNPNRVPFLPKKALPGGKKMLKPAHPHNTAGNAAVARKTNGTFCEFS